MENIALVIGAILGSTGLASLANSFSVWGRRTKLRNSIKQMSEDIKAMKDPSAEREAYEASMSVQALELASLSLIRVKPGIVLLLSLFLGTILLVIGLNLLWVISTAREESVDYLKYPLTFTVGITIYTLWIACCQFIFTQARLAGKRNRFVAAAWNAGHATSELILEHSSYLNLDPSKSEENKGKIRKLRKGSMPNRQQDSSSDDS